jgi:hypothetical protein
MAEMTEPGLGAVGKMMSVSSNPKTVWTRPLTNRTKEVGGVGGRDRLKSLLIPLIAPVIVSLAVLSWL